MKKINKHIPVLLNETIKNLNLKDDGVYVDATLGMGGYTRKILDNSNCTLIGIDRDPFAIEEALPLIKKYGVRLKLINGLFSNIEQILKELKIQRINGITFDFGVSSPQLENHKRGFSFKLDGPLDMRMDQDDKSLETAMEIINNYSFEDLSKIFFEFGEERYSKKIAKNILPSQSKKIKLYKNKENSLFASHNIEFQINELQK